LDDEPSAPAVDMTNFITRDPNAAAKVYKKELEFVKNGKKLPFQEP
jgi:hypothetical protein